MLIGDGVSHDGDGVFLGIFDSLGFKLATWVSDRWLGFANRWLGWWVWWPLLALTGLMVCVCVALLMVCVCVCVRGSVCVVMGLDRLIGVSWVFVCVALCVEPMLEVEVEREEKEEKKKNSKKKE